MPTGKLLLSLQMALDLENVYCLQIHFGEMKGAREQTVACEKECCGQKYMRP